MIPAMTVVKEHVKPPAKVDAKVVADSHFYLCLVFCKNGANCSYKICDMQIYTNPILMKKNTHTWIND